MSRRRWRLGMQQLKAVVARYARLQVTALVTLVIIGAEFGFLVSVYDRGAPVRTQMVLVAHLDGQLQHADASSALALVRAATPDLQRAGLPSNEWLPVTTSADALTVQPTPADLGRLQSAVQQLTDHLGNDSASIDTQARYIYIALLLVVSLGWMAWFRRLVARHRSLERSVAEHEAVAKGEHRLAELVRNSGDLVAVLDADFTVSYVTTSAAPMLGVEAQTLTGAPLLEYVLDVDRPLLVQSLSRTRAGEDTDVQLRVQQPAGRVLHIEGTLRNLVEDSAVAGYVLTARDVTDRVELESRLTHQAMHDPLTGLSNRRLFKDRLDHALERRGPEHVSVLFCDLDDFKDVNDSLGHAAGDELLMAVAQRCNEVVRVGDTVARFGGDEFAVLLEDADDQLAREIADRLIEAIGAPLTIQEKVMTVRASIGVAMGVVGSVGSDELLRNADVALYQAKDNGKAAAAVYEPHMHELALERLQLRADLHRALREGDLELHYQPTINLTTGHISGFEALARWPHPVHGMISPAVFIPLAEKSGLIYTLGEWAIHTACAAAAAMHAAGHIIRMSVNVTAAQLAREDFTHVVLAALSASGLSAEYLTLEITESALLDDLTLASDRLTALRQLGIRVAIDDFGTGYSSLRYLQDLPVDILKIDKSFVDHVGADNQGTSLVNAIITMGQSLSLSIIAEGVEQPSQAQWLDQAHCQHGQGFLWSPAVPLDNAQALLTAATNSSAA